MRRTYSITAEPVGSVYKSLLTVGATVCPHALVVVRPSPDLRQSGMELLSRLLAWHGVEQVASEWPGTRLLKGAATTVRFDLSNESMAVLASVTGLYSWRQPERPEDLCLLRRDGSPWLGSIAHERDSFLELDDAEVAAVRIGVPGLELVGEVD